MRFSNLRHWIGTALLSAAVALGIPSATYALQVKPIIFDMNTVGAGSRTTITVINSAATPVPMELQVNRLDLGPNGEMIKTPGGGDDFMIFPPQTVIPPNSTQTFRIHWIGDPEIPESRSYNIEVNQLPVEAPKVAEGETRMSIQLVYSFVTTVTVRPPQGTSSFQVQKAEFSRNDQGQSGVALTVENTGNLHNYLANAEVQLEAGSWSKRLTPQTVRVLAGPGLVLPRHMRRIFIPLEDVPGNTGALSATVSFKN